MRTAEAKIITNIPSTPAGYARVAFDVPPGKTIVAMVKMGVDWTIDVRIDDSTGQIFCCGVSPNKQEIRVERWLDSHRPKIRVLSSKDEQEARLGGDADVLSADEIIEVLKSELTDGDTPRPFRKINMSLVEQDIDGASCPVAVLPDVKPYPCWRVKFAYGMRYVQCKTKPIDNVKVFMNEDLTAFFAISDRHSHWFVEWAAYGKRHEATVEKTSLGTFVASEALAKIVSGTL